jgi:glycosyltransferase involved in cell wall biosynthesis
MAMEKAVVSTTVGAEGLPLTNGVELLLADEPATFADAVVRVLTDRDYAAELGRGAATVVRENFGWRQVTERFISICGKTFLPRMNADERRSASSALIRG